MYRRPYLQIPGPTNIPEPVLNALNRSVINHRGAEFASIMADNIQGLKEVFQTKNDILIFPSSGSGTLEASIVNLLSPGDRVLAVNMGVFSQRYGQIAEAFGAKVEWIEIEWGQALSPQKLRDALLQDKEHEIKAILLTHNETSTGVTNDIASLRATIDEIKHPALVLVDAVSSLAITDLPTDDLDLDVVITGSQKGLMLPGGLGIISISEKAWKAHTLAQMPKWYWNLTPLKQRMDIGQMPYTPAISHFFGLKAALRLIRAEGLHNVFHRHHQNAEAVRVAVLAMGLKLFVTDEARRSDSVTAIVLPEGINYEDLADKLANDYAVIIGGGLHKLKGKVFRIGHLGMLHAPEVMAIISALEMSLIKLGYKTKKGAAVAAAMSIYLL